ncbi:hypothetical protein KCP73_08555 [Salmonella enterica subsp. enterica]|nr:hypothetical protein KCP73_08555 [Salmonella enterica subsp. enterica]
MMKLSPNFAPELPAVRLLERSFAREAATSAGAAFWKRGGSTHLRQRSDCRRRLCSLTLLSRRLVLNTNVGGRFMSPSTWRRRAG